MEENEQGQQEELVTVELGEEAGDGAEGQTGQTGQAARAEPENSGAAPAGDEAGGQEDGKNPPPQNAEANHRQAWARRKREEEARRAELEQAHRAEVDAIYAKAYEGMTDPYTGQPIRTKADYDAYVAHKDAEGRKQKLAKLGEAGVDAEALRLLVDQAVEQNPAVAQAREMAEQARAAMAQAEQEKTERTIEAELREIAVYDASVKSADDLQSRYPESWERTLELCRKGVRLSEAFKIANFDALMRSTSAAGRQAERNSAASKAHMRPMKAAQKAGAVTMPKDVLEEFRRINPGHTDAEYAKFWAKQHKED